MDTSFPEKIYHYTSADGLHGILSSGTLFFTDSLFLNDRSERKDFYLILKDYIQNSDLDEDFKNLVWNRYFGKNDYISKYLKRARPSDGAASRYFVLSCSKSSDSLPMWNYYTHSVNASGYNIHFDAEKLIAQIKAHPLIQLLETRHIYMPSVLYREIIYNRKQKSREIAELLHRSQREFKEQENETILRKLDLSFEGMSLFYKDSAFSHEKELRIVIATDNESVHGISENQQNGCYQFRKVRGVQVPHLNLEVLEKGKVITGVTAGPALDKELAANGAAYMLHYYGFPQSCKVSDVPLRY